MFPRKHDVVTTSDIAYFCSEPNFSSGFAFIQVFLDLNTYLLAMAQKVLYGA